MAENKKCGIYAIVSPSGRRYIGSTKDFKHNIVTLFIESVRKSEEQQKQRVA